MVALNFNMLGFAYQQGVDWLETGFATCASAMVSHRAKLSRDLEAYEVSVSAGGERIGEWEEGHRLWEQDQVFAMQIDDAEESLMDLRKAYVLAAYHHWERAARRWSRISNHAKHSKLITATRDLGYPIDPRLEGLHDLVNTLKHNSVGCASKLILSWPDVLKADPAARPDLDWYGCIEIEDRHVHEVCEIIRGSGPNAELSPTKVEQGGD